MTNEQIQKQLLDLDAERRASNKWFLEKAAELKAQLTGDSTPALEPAAEPKVNSLVPTLDEFVAAGYLASDYAQAFGGRTPNTPAARVAEMPAPSPPESDLGPPRVIARPQSVTIMSPGPENAPSEPASSEVSDSE